MGFTFLPTCPFAGAPSKAAAGDMTIANGGVAQWLFQGSTPPNGFSVFNPDPSEDLWISDSTTAATNGMGSIRIAANGGGYETPEGYSPVGPVSVYGATAGHKVIAGQW